MTKPEMKKLKQINQNYINKLIQNINKYSKYIKLYIKYIYIYIYINLLLI